MTDGSKRYLLTLLVVILAFNMVDRWMLGLVLQDIKSDLHLSDTELGLLSGIAFALFYSLAGIPIARWADRGDRVTLIAATIALWSGAMALCGLATSFLQLLLIRVVVAVGEAGCIPAAHSLIADYCTRAERPRAAARFMLGGPLSVLMGYLIAGWLNEFYGWRATYMLVGLPGVLLGLLAWLTLREPRRSRPSSTQAHPGSTVTARAPPGLKQVCATLWANTTFRHLLCGFSVIYFFGAGIATWQPAFLMRSYGMDTGALGTWFTVIYGLGGLLGTYWGGEWASRYAAGDERRQLKAIAAAYCVFGVISSGVYFAPNQYVAFALMGVGAVGVNMAIGPIFGTLQTLIPERMRALSVALIYLFANLIGLGVGPLLAGALSDVLTPRLGSESLRYALLALCPGYIWGAWHYWRASGTVLGDMAP
jgi:MFS family permease